MITTGITTQLKVKKKAVTLLLVWVLPMLIPFLKMRKRRKAVSRATAPVSCKYIVVRSFIEFRGASAYLDDQSVGLDFMDSKTASEYSMFIKQEVPSHTKMTRRTAQSLKKTKSASNPKPPRLVKYMT